MKLSNRLQCIANLIDKCEISADIGTDHAYLPIYLIGKGVCKKVIASDVKNEPAKKAIRNIAEVGYENFIDVRIGNGLEVLNEHETETIIISGMGAAEINRILEKNVNIAKTARNLILQPMTQHFKLRSWLKKNNYIISDEDLCKEEGRIYLVLKVGYDEKRKDDSNIYFGNILFQKKHPLLPEYIQKYIREYEDVRMELISSDSISLNQRIKEIEVKIELFYKLLRITKNIE